MDPVAYWGIVIGVIAPVETIAGLLWHAGKGPSKRQIEQVQRTQQAQTRRLDAIQQTLGQMMEYRDGLHKTVEPVRDLFEKGQAAMKEYE